MSETGCPYKKECATVTYWSKEKGSFIQEVCNTDKHTECIHYSCSLKPQHDERERLYGDPHANEPDWDKLIEEETGFTSLCVVPGCDEKATSSWPLLPGAPGFCTEHYEKAAEYGADLS